jgi:hypothetical protein
MTELVQEVTAEEVAKHYSAALDSVALINAGKPEDMTDEDWADCRQRNIDHLNIQLAKAEMYAGYDLTPFEQAVA